MNKDIERPDFDSDEREILSLLKNIYEEEDDPSKTPSSPPVDMPVKKDESSDTKWLLPLVEPLPEEAPPKPPAPKKAVSAAPDPATKPTAPAAHAASYLSRQQVTRILQTLIPVKGDSVADVTRKSVLLISLAVFLCSLVVLLYYMVIEPRSTQNDNARYADLYYDTRGNDNHQTENAYPEGMQADFRQLYDINPDVAGWLSFHSTDNSHFLQIDLPVVHSGDNETYLNRAFDGSKSRSGTLFFDASNTFSPGERNKVSIIYGHNMASGLMFAKLNQLMSNVYYARSAPIITMNTLYENSQYQVFAVLLLDEDAPDDHYFNYLRTSFADDADFTNYVHRVRARSLYNYPISIDPDDNLLVLSTCTNRSQAKLSNGRLAVFARRVDSGSAYTDTSLIEKNEDVIMPYAWYTAQGMTPHSYYSGSTESAATTGTTTGSAATTIDTTTPSTASTTATEEDDRGAGRTKGTIPSASKSNRTKTTKGTSGNATGTTVADTTDSNITASTDTPATQTEITTQEDAA